MEGETYEVIVVGAGVQGSATAYYLASHGVKTLLLEQFGLPHTRGSSHGQSRIIRMAYTQSHYGDMMPEAFQQWHQLERETGVQLYKKCGLLAVGKSPCQGIENTKTVLTRLGCTYHCLDGSQIRQQYPMLRFDEDFVGVFDPTGGILRADKALAALQGMFVKYGGTLKDCHPVTGITPGSTARVHTDQGTFLARSVVITAGSWTSTLVKPLGVHLPLSPLRIKVFYWKQLAPKYDLAHGFPVVISTHEVNGQEVDWYSLPGDEYPGYLKLCVHTGPPIDPDQRDCTKETWDVDMVSKFVREHCPYLEDRPSIVETCIYTNTPDTDFILDTHPAWKNIVIGAGFSGTGFKLAPVVGKVLGELATGKRPSYDLTPFRMDRFLNKPPAAKL